MTAGLASSDFLRTPVLAAARPDGFKEWHHFVVHGQDCRLLINMSINDEQSGQGHFAPRVIVVTHDRQWTGAVERFDGSAMKIAENLSDLVIGGNRMTLGPGGYRVTLDLPENDIRGQIDFVPVSKPFVVNNQPVGRGQMCWLFVPRLRANGWVRMGSQQHRFDNDLAYHDHNWGRFWWGDDFGWTWATILPESREEPWSLVFLQMTDRRRLKYLSQALYVWYQDEPAAIFRHAAVSTSSQGTLARDADCTLPPPMGLLIDGAVPGVPEKVEITAANATDTVHAKFLSRSYARLAQPSEMFLDRSTVLCEASGSAKIHGTIDGDTFDFAGVGVFEFLYG